MTRKAPRVRRIGDTGDPRAPFPVLNPVALAGGREGRADAWPRRMERAPVTIPASLCSRLVAIHAWVSAVFLPGRITGHRDAAKQARIFLMSHLFGPVLGFTVPLALYAFDPTPGADIAVLAASIGLFWAFPFGLRLGVPYAHLVLLSILNLNFAILWSCFHYGGVASPTRVWILIIPILAIFYVGGERRLTHVVLVASGLAFAAFLALYLALDPGPNDLPPRALIGLGATSTAATLAYVAAMAIYYARIFDAGVDLEREVKRRHAMAVELRAAVAAAHRASAAKSKFLARMSHELRNPLNAVIGYGQLLQEEAKEGGDGMMERDVERILDAGRYLVRLIDMILDLSKIEAGRMRFDARPHELRALLEEAVERRRAAIEGAGNRVELDLAPDLGRATLDSNRLGEILDSVLENAAQHTDGGRVALRARRERGAGGAPDTVSVTVRDTGCGIAPEVLASVFETFATARDAAGGRYGGTGLSLAVSSRLCRAMGGSLAARSRPGEGSAFTVTLPTEPPAPSCVPTPALPTAPPLAA